MATRAEVVPDVQLVHVETEGDVVTADVFGGTDLLIVGEVSFHIHDPEARRRVEAQFRRWANDGNLLTFVHGEDGQVTFVDEAGSFDSAMGR